MGAGVGGRSGWDCKGGLNKVEYFSCSTQTSKGTSFCFRSSTNPVNLGRSNAFVDNEIFYNVSIVSSNYETFSETGERGREREGGENVRGKRILIKPAAFPKEILYVSVLIYIYRYQFTIFVLPFKTLYLIVVGLALLFSDETIWKSFWKTGLDRKVTWHGAHAQGWFYYPNRWSIKNLEASHL